MTQRLPWCRFYHETLDDPKIERAGRVTGQPKVVVVGAWSILMALANRSPIRGALVLTEDIPLTVSDLADEMGLPLNDAETLLGEFTRYQMLHQEDGVFYLTHWAERNPPSDDSSARVQRCREKHKTAETQSEPADCNGAVTGADCDSHALEKIRSDQTRSDQIRQDESQLAADGAPSGASTISFDDWLTKIERGPNRTAILIDGYSMLFPGRDRPDYGRMGAFAKRVKGPGRAWQLLWQAASQRPAGDPLDYAEGIARNNGKSQAKGRRTPAAEMGDDARARRRYIEGPYAEFIEH